jgi:hypothetical protein
MDPQSQHVGQECWLTRMYQATKRGVHARQQFHLFELKGTPEISRVLW